MSSNHIRGLHPFGVKCPLWIKYPASFLTKFHLFCPDVSLHYLSYDWLDAVFLCYSAVCHAIFFTFHIPPMTVSIYSLREYKLTTSLSSRNETRHRHCKKLITMAQRSISLSNLTCKMFSSFPSAVLDINDTKDWPHAGPIHAYYACACTREGE